MSGNQEDVKKYDLKSFGDIYLQMMFNAEGMTPSQE
jgi:hypothetical protein